LVILESYDEKLAFFPAKVKQDSLLYSPILKVSTTTIPALKESSIFLKNAMQLDTASYTEQDVVRAQFIADSLGIAINDSVELRNLFLTYEK
jgi:membrane protein required for colicin V production